jgi:hypothetical protein
LTGFNSKHPIDLHRREIVLHVLTGSDSWLSPSQIARGCGLSVQAVSLKCLPFLQERDFIKAKILDAGVVACGRARWVYAKKELPAGAPVTI